MVIDRSKALPHDWRQVHLRDICSEPLRYGINAAAVHHSDQLPTYIRITDITADGRLDPTSKVSVDDHSASAYLLDDDDILLARTGASVGKSYRHRQLGHESYVYAGFLIRAKIDQAKAIPAYVAATLNTGEYWGWVAITSQRSGQPGINGQEYGSFKLPLPPLSEQQAIAEVLSDMDALITAQEALIEKKRAIKQGVMQELLTGRKRLPGFAEAWEKHRLGDVARIIGGGTPSTNNPDYWDGDIKWCTPTDLTNTSGKYLKSTRRSITELGMSNSSTTLLPRGTLLFCSRASIGEMKISTEEMTTNQGFQSIIVNHSFDNEFLYYLISQNINLFLKRSKGSTFLEISAASIRSIDFNFPAYKEQRAISGILSEMDEEIRSLETGMDKMRNLKYGLMHELLSGHIRLVHQNGNA